MRINFLQQARHLVLAQVGGPVGSRLAASMGHHVTAVGKKSQVRLSTEIKKTLCKVRKLSVCLSLMLSLRAVPGSFYRHWQRRQNWLGSTERRKY